VRTDRDESVPTRRQVLRGAAAGGIALSGAEAHSAEQRHDRVRRVADAAMDGFDHGWRTGDWQPFLATLTNDVSFWFPEDPARGRFEGAAGRRAVREWTDFHSRNGNRVIGERRRTTTAGDRVFYEYDSRGASPNTAAYRNWELIVVQVRGSRVCALHEYWGDARPAAGGAVGAPRG
jgi:ketosteroid isomerase-like protein